MLTAGELGDACPVRERLELALYNRQGLGPPLLTICLERGVLPSIRLGLGNPRRALFSLSISYYSSRMHALPSVVARHFYIQG